MSTGQSSATAYETLSTLSATREAWHRIRFACIKQVRALKDLKGEMERAGLLTPEFSAANDTMQEMCYSERMRAWQEIERLDGQITTLTAQINNGVYDEIR